MRFLYNYPPTSEALPFPLKASRCCDIESRQGWRVQFGNRCGFELKMFLTLAG